MGALDQVTQLKGQGLSDDQIISRLQQQGVSPKEINDAFSQSDIKNAVSADEDTPEGMEPSVLQQGSSPKTHEDKEQEQDLYAPKPVQPEPMMEYAPQDYYQEGGYGGYAPEGMDTDTIIEIAEQVFSERIKKLQKQVTEMNEFKTLAQAKLDNVAERVKKIEGTIDKLQSAVLDKVGSYGQNLEGIKKEMSMMQDSFGKMVKHATATKHAVPSLTVPAEKKKSVSKKKTVKKK